jgi:hypothetical protein
MSSRHPDRLILALAATLLLATPASAQEDIEPRVVGESGTMTIGVSGFIDRFSSSESTFPTHATLHVDVSRFVTGRFAVRGGLIGSTAFGGDEDAGTGPGAAAIDAVAGIFYYFTPQSMASFYTGAEYRAPLTRRAAKEPGSALAIAGLQAAVSSRAAVFVQGGYGSRLTHGDEGELQLRVAGEVGFRIRF